MRESTAKPISAMLPERRSGPQASWRHLAGYARATPKKQASAINEALESAFDIAHRDGRDSITYEDIDAAIKLEFKPLETATTVCRSRQRGEPRLRTDVQKFRNVEPLQVNSQIGRQPTRLETTP